MSDERFGFDAGEGLIFDRTKPCKDCDSDEPCGLFEEVTTEGLIEIANSLVLRLGDLQTRFDAVWQRAEKLDAAVGERDGHISSRLGRALELLRAVQAAKQKPGISNGEDSGSFNIVLHGNWFIVAASVVATSGDGAKADSAVEKRREISEDERLREVVERERLRLCRARESLKMSDVKRYQLLDQPAEMDECADGEWVKFDDFNAMVLRLNERSKYEEVLIASNRLLAEERDAALLKLAAAIVFVNYIAKRYEEGWSDPITERFYNEAVALLEGGSDEQA